MIAALFLAGQLSGEDLASPSPWKATLTTPGGPLEFDIAFERESDRSLHAFLLNGNERIEVPRVEFDGSELLLDMPHYDSRIRARLEEHHLVGTWQKRRSADSAAELPFEATRSGCDMPGGGNGSPPFVGRWRVDFEGDEQDAIAVFEGHLDELRGTFLTSTGDYRYLEGWAGWRNREDMSLSCFDGAHAFLFEAKLQPDGTLKGDFWSGNWHHETWTAKRDDAAALPDAFAQTKWNGATKLADLVFQDLDGKKRSLADFAGKATLLVVFGSWCPNCNDEAALLKELDAKYRARGLAILGLAFELTGERERDAGQVRLFAERHGLSIPFFLCGTADKDAATKALGLVDRVRAFPTTIFVGADGLPRAIHSGFSGPATGEEHVRLRRAFEERIEALLGPPPAPR